MLPVTRDDIVQFYLDAESTTAQLECAHRAAEVGSRIPDVEAVALRGSLARGTGDVYSDADVLVVHSGGDEVWQRVEAIFVERLHEIGEPLFQFRSIGRPKDLVVFFKPWVKVELEFQTAEHASASWMTAGSNLLFDRSGVGQRVVQDANAEFDSMALREEMVNLLVALPAFSVTAWGHWSRGECLSALYWLDWIRGRLLWLSGAVLGLRNEGPRRAETRFPQEVIEYWYRCYPEKVEDVPRAALSALRWQRDWLGPRLEEQGVEYGSDALQLAELVLQAQAAG